MKKTVELSLLAQSLNIACDTTLSLTGINTLKDAKEGELAFLDNSKYLSDLSSTHASAVLLKEEFVELLPKGVIPLVTNEPYLALAYASKFFSTPQMRSNGTDAVVGENSTVVSSVFLGKDVVIGANVTLMAGCAIMDGASVGEGSILYPNVTVYPDCHVGKMCIIHAGTVIGSDGFGFAHTRLGEHVKIYQNGNVVVEDDVEIGANCAIDRAVFGTTFIKKGAKLDNLVQIGHNCVVGEYSLLAGQVGLAGSSTLERNVVMGGQSATAGHLNVGAFATIAGRGGATKSIEGKKTYSGFPLMEHKTWLKLQAVLSKMVK